MISQKKIQAYLDACKERDSYIRAFEEEGIAEADWKFENPARYSVMLQARMLAAQRYAKLTGGEIGAIRRHQATGATTMGASALGVLVSHVNEQIEQMLKKGIR
jgi:hypothetical protein